MNIRTSCSLLAALPLSLGLLAGCSGEVDDAATPVVGEDDLKTANVAGFAKQLGLGNPLGAAKLVGGKMVREYRHSANGATKTSKIYSDAADRNVVAVDIEGEGGDRVLLDGVALEATWTYGLSGFQYLDTAMGGHLGPSFANGSIRMHSPHHTCDLTGTPTEQELAACHTQADKSLATYAPNNLGSSLGHVRGLNIGDDGNIPAATLWLSYHYRTRMGRFVGFFDVGYKYTGGSIVATPTRNAMGSVISTVYVASIQDAGTNGRSIPVEKCTDDGAAYVCELLPPAGAK